MKNTVKLREMERETKHITMVSFQVMFSLPRFLAKKRKRPENVCNSVLTEILTYLKNHIYIFFCVKWMSSHELLCLTVKLQSSIKRTYYSVASLSNTPIPQMLHNYKLL